MKNGAAQRKVSHESQEKDKLNAKSDQVRNQDRDRYGQAGKIDLAEERRVIHKDVGSLGQAAGEIGPDHRAGHVEEELGQAIGGQFGDVAKDDREGDGGQQRLDEVPQRSKNRLLVHRDKVAAHEHRNQVFIAE